MAGNVQIFQVFPWTGGLNTSLDPSMVSPQQLTQADNVQFTTQGTRLKREGIDFNWDSLEIETVSRSSSGTTRTITVSGYTFAAGDIVTITGMSDARYNVPTGQTATLISGSDTTITYTFSGATSFSESTTADVGGIIGLLDPIIKAHDYWYGTTNDKAQRLAAITSRGKFIIYDAGVPEVIVDAGTAYTIPLGGLKNASMVTFQNRLIVAVEGQGNPMKHYFPVALGGSGELEDVENTADYEPTPEPLCLQVHLGRLICNDKNNPDRLHYSETGVYNVWQGAGDSGAIDISPGDGDPVGITAIFPPFKGVLAVAKRTKLYQMPGNTPENISIQLMSDNIGCVGPNAFAAVDQDDVLFMSDKGIHSLLATNATGSFSGSYVSSDIQRSVNTIWSHSRFQYTQAVYIPSLNSIAWSVSENGSEQDALYFFNYPLKAWYRWPKLDCQSITLVQDFDRQRLYLGNKNSRIAQAFNTVNYDINAAGARQAISLVLKTGLIYVDTNPSSTKAFKKLGLIYKVKGAYSFTANVKIDNFTPQTVLYSSSFAGDVLAPFTPPSVGFSLNRSILGLEQVVSTYQQQIDGYGRGIVLTITQSGVDQFGEIIGYQMFYEALGVSQETRSGDNS